MIEIKQEKDDERMTFEKLIRDSETKNPSLYIDHVRGNYILCSMKSMLLNSLINKQTKKTLFPNFCLLFFPLEPINAERNALICSFLCHRTLIKS